MCKLRYSLRDCEFCTCYVHACDVHYMTQNSVNPFVFSNYSTPSKCDTRWAINSLLLWNPKIHHIVDFIIVHTVFLYSQFVCYSSIYVLVSEVVSSLDILDQYFVYKFLIFACVFVSRPSHFLCLMAVPVLNFETSPYTVFSVFLLFYLFYFILFWKTLIMCPLLRVRYRDSHRYLTAGKTVVLYQKWKIKYSELNISWHFPNITLIST
jgi:hypothetical protein